MKILKVRSFAQFCRKQGIDDNSLIKAVEEIESGLVHAPLGNGLFKQRIARAGGGKSGGYRTILIFRAGSIALFLFGFPKNVRENIAPEELRRFRHIAGRVLTLNEADIDREIEAGRWLELAKNG